MENFNKPNSKLSSIDEIVVGTTGPFTLLCAAVFLQQKGWKDLPVSAFHFEHCTDTVLESEKWLCQALGITYRGNLGRLGSAAKQVAKNFWRTAKDWRIPDFLFSWQSWGHEQLSPVDTVNIKHIILPFRPRLSDVLLANLFPSASVHYIADGLLMGHPTSLKLPLLWRICRLRNPFAPSDRQKIWTLSGLSKAVMAFGQPHELEEKYFLQLANKIVNNPDFAAWLHELFPQDKSIEYSCILLQNLQGKWLDPFEEISLYAKIIDKELRISNADIIVKPHPRDNAAKLTLLKLLIPEEQRKRVHFMEVSALSVLPVELMLECLPIRTLIGLCSTALLTAGRYSNQVKVHLYTSQGLPWPLQEEIARCARAGNFALCEL